MVIRSLRTVPLVVLVVLLAACAGEPGERAERPSDARPDAGSTPNPPHSDAGISPAPEIRIEGMFARGAHPLADGGALVVYERPVHTKERWGRPLRSLVWTDAVGAPRLQREATPGRELLDAAVHPSGEVTIVEASDAGYFLLRLDALGNVRADEPLVDPAILTDPPAILANESRSPIELVTHDGARLVAEGEGVFLGARTGRHSVVAYRVAFEGKAFAVRTRTLVVPAHNITPTAMYGGTYDTFGQLDAHYGVFVAVETSGAGTGFVGVGHARLDNGSMVKAHAKVFGEQLATDPDYLDAFVTRVSPTGERLGTSVVGTADDDQLYALRATPRGVYALGRTEPNDTGGIGFDALVARVDNEGNVAVTTFDVDRGDIAFDCVLPEQGGILVVGASGYSQNPSGASISEESHTFARWLQSEGRITPVPVPDGPRHSEARFVFAQGNTFLTGGMLDGPGTHSADGDLALLRSRAFLSRVEKSSFTDVSR